MSEDSNTARGQALVQIDSIGQMMDALQCDFDQLEYLRDELEGLKGELEEAAADFGTASEEATAARDALHEWKDASGEELAELETAAGECKDHDDASERIQQTPLSVEVRSGWASPGETLTPDEFRIVLCTGGPHVELVGELGGHAEPSRVRVLYRDWGTSGELHDFDPEVVLGYCQQFYFGG